MPTLTEMRTLTETVIDIADRHTTLYYLCAKPPAGPLPFQTEEAYCALLRRSAGKRTKFSDAATDRTQTMLDRFTPSHSNNKYWLRYVGTNALAFSGAAWSRFLPLDASLSARILHVPNPALPIRVSPIPRVRLYPFGWSTWISFRLLGAHSISDLATFLESLFADDALKYDCDSPVMSLSKFFADVARGVRADAFGGEETLDFDSQEIAVVTTVMAKRNGSPALGALGVREQRTLQRIARPYGRPPGDPFAERVYRLPPGTSDLEYSVHDKHGRFLWVEHLLREPDKRKNAQLRCYHNNSFASLDQAWHLHALLDAIIEQAQRAQLTRVAFEMAQAAQGLLAEPPYKSASLRQYLIDHESALKQTATKLAVLKIPKSGRRSDRRSRRG